MMKVVPANEELTMDGMSSPGLIVTVAARAKAELRNAKMANAMIGLSDLQDGTDVGETITPLQTGIASLVERLLWSETRIPHDSQSG
jgi:hypothetical protein